MATLISSGLEEFSIKAQDPNAGFTKNEISRLIRADGKAFRLYTGELLIVNFLACNAMPEDINPAATSLLRTAIDDPGGDVCGCALLLDPEEADRLSPAAGVCMAVDANQELRTVLLLDDDDEVRRVIALGFERHHCHVVQARAFPECLSFCQQHKIDLLVADVTSLCPDPLRGRKSIEAAQPDAGILLISGYDDLTIEEWYPGLLSGLYFFKKPFHFSFLTPLLHNLQDSPKNSRLHLVVKRPSGSGREVGMKNGSAVAPGEHGQ